MRKIKLSARLLAFPKQCCCCNAMFPSDEYVASAIRTKGKRVIATTTRSWAFPICKKCHSWIRADEVASKMRMVLLFSIVIACIVPLLKNEKSDVLLFWGIPLGFVIGIFTIWLRSRRHARAIKPAATCCNPPVIFLGWDGTVMNFLLENEDFLIEFEKLNTDKVIR